MEPWLYAHLFPRVKLNIERPHGGASHRTHANLHVIDELNDDIILGKDWLDYEDPDVRWRENAIIFSEA